MWVTFYQFTRILLYTYTHLHSTYLQRIVKNGLDVYEASLCKHLPENEKKKKH